MTLNLDRSGWQKMRVGDFAENVNDRVDDPKTAGVSRYVGLEHLDPGCLTVNRWGTPDQVEATKLRFKPGDVIFGRRRAYQKKVARADFAGICSAHAMVLRAKPAVVDPEFLAVFLSSDYFLERAIKISVGSLSPTVNWKALAVQEFELPPLDQQRRIAALLWAVETQRMAANRSRAAVVGLTEVRASIYFSAQSERSSLALSDLCDTLTVGVVVKPTQYYAPSGVPALRSLNIRPGGFVLDDLVFFSREAHQQLSKSALAAGDVVIVRTGRPGEAAVVDQSVAGSNAIDLIIARPGPGLHPQFLCRFLNSATGKALALRGSAGTAQQHLNVGALAKLMIPEISMQEQLALVTELEEADSVAVRLDMEIAAVGHLRSSILNELLGAR